MKNLILILSITLLFFSCNQTVKPSKNIQSKKPKKELAAHLKSISLHIEGMTCEIGCARTIQSKISKLDGVSYAKVNFNAKEGIFTYDANKLSQNDIINKIDAIAGGDLYKASKATEIETVSKKTN